MKLFGWKSGRDESRPVLSRSSAGAPGGSAFGEWPRSYEAQVREAYLDNPIAQRAVKLVVEGLGSAPIVASDPALLALATVRSGGQTLIETVAAHLMLHGNAYVQVLRDVEGGAAELYALRPERVTVEPDASGWPAAYRYRVGERVARLHADPVRPEVIHLKSFNPVDDHYGLGCLGAASGAVAIHNAAARWNKALLDNAARPSGADGVRAFGTLQYLASGTAGDFSASPQERLIDLVQSLRGPYRQGASFVMNAATLARIRKFKTTDGAFVWAPSLAAGQPATLLGYPVVEAEDMPDIAANALAIAFGNFRAGYLIAERTETGILRDPYSNKPFVSFYATKRVSGAADMVVGATILRAIEVPGLDDAPLTAPRMTVAAAGVGPAWRQAALLYSIDDGASWVTAGATAAPAVLGTIMVVAPGAPAALVDRRGMFEVTLAHADMELGDADAAALDRGVNLALLGDELVQFGRAEPLGSARWRLSGLLRGRRGTEAATGAQMVGDRFVLIEAEAARTFDLPLSVLGREMRVMASGVGDATPVETRCVMRGASVVPPSPVHLGWRAEADGSATVRWTRRSRAGWRWIDGVDAPLAEEREAYRVTIATGGSSRDVEVLEPSVSVNATERARTFSIAVRQRGMFGESLAAELIVPA